MENGGRERIEFSCHTSDQVSDTFWVSSNSKILWHSRISNWKILRTGLSRLNCAWQILNRNWHLINFVNHQVEAEEYQTNESLLSETIIDEEKGLESKIGSVGLAWLGNFVLLFAIVFFTEYIITQGHRLLSVVIGVFSVGIIFWISNYLKNNKFKPVVYVKNKWPGCSVL